MESISNEQWAQLETMTPEEQTAWWDARRKQELEEHFQQIMNAPFEKLRSEYYDKRYNRPEALFIQNLLEEKLGVKDPEGEMPEEDWRHSNWCA